MIQNKTVIITGSTRGIGYGLALEFLKRGHNVAINGTKKKRVQETIDKLPEFSNQLIGIPGDVVKKSTHERLFDLTNERFGQVDIWINNAGITGSNVMAIDIEKSDIKAVYDINIKGTTMGTVVALKKMKMQGHGQIFNMEGFGSDGRMMKKMTIYGTSKCALRYFTRSISKEAEETPVQIGTLNPGIVITDLILNSLDTTTPKELEKTKRTFNILGERVETVTPFLVEKILKSRKNNDEIAFLTKRKIMWKFLKSRFKKNDFFGEI